MKNTGTLKDKSWYVNCIILKVNGEYTSNFTGSLMVKKEKESLKRILSVLIELYRDLEEILVKERKAVINASVDDIISITSEKEKIVREIEMLSKGMKLRELVEEYSSSRFGNLNDSDGGDLGSKDSITPLIKELKSQCYRVHALNLDNKGLIESAISYTRDWLLYLQSLMNPQLIYAKEGRIVGSSRVGNVVNREG